MDVYSFFSEMEQPETKYGDWLLRAIGAGGENTNISWDQYLEVKYTTALSVENTQPMRTKLRRKGSSALRPCIKK